MPYVSNASSYFYNWGGYGLVDMTLEFDLRNDLATVSVVQTVYSRKQERGAQFVQTVC